MPNPLCKSCKVNPIPSDLATYGVCGDCWNAIIEPIESRLDHALVYQELRSNRQRPTVHYQFTPVDLGELARNKNMKKRDYSC